MLQRAAVLLLEVKKAAGEWRTRTLIVLGDGDFDGSTKAVPEGGLH